jgi:hypothetical protein
MDPEDDEVDDKGEDDQCPSSSEEVSGKVGLKCATPTRGIISACCDIHDVYLSRPTILCPFFISKIPHKSHKTAPPIVINVNKPTILHPKVQARKNPVDMR